MPAHYSGSTPFVAHTHRPRHDRWRGTFSYHLFSLTLSGGATYAVPEGRMEIGAGDLLHFAPQAHQDWQVDHVHGWKVAYLIIAVPPSMRQLLPVSNVTTGIARVTLTARDSTRFARVFREMQSWSEQRSAMREPLILNLLEHLLLRLRNAKPIETADARVELARDFLHANLEAPIMLTDVARAAGLSRARLSALFRDHVHTTPMAYLEQLRLEQAARLLLFSSATIPDIAERLGYRERGYFEKRFKRHWGTTPKAYRVRETST